MSNRTALHWTPEQLDAYYRKHGIMAELLREEKPPARGVLRRSRIPNKTEAEFRRMLEARAAKGEFLSVEFEAVKLKVGDGSYYCPDFFCRTDAKPRIFEVKGRHRWDDAVVKYKAAKVLHPWAEFEMWQKDADGWRQIG